MADRIHRVQGKKFNDFADYPSRDHTHFLRSSLTFVAVRVPLLSKIGNLSLKTPQKPSENPSKTLRKPFENPAL
jgi:hypothetical protein